MWKRFDTAQVPCAGRVPSPRFSRIKISFCYEGVEQMFLLVSAIEMFLPVSVTTSGSRGLYL